MTPLDVVPRVVPRVAAAIRRAWWAASPPDPDTPLPGSGGLINGAVRSAAGLTASQEPGGLRPSASSTPARPAPGGATSMAAWAAGVVGLSLRDSGVPFTINTLNQPWRNQPDTPAMGFAAYLREVGQ